MNTPKTLASGSPASNLLSVEDVRRHVWAKERCSFAHLLRYGKAVFSREMMTSATMTPEEELAAHCRKCPSCLQKLAELQTSLGMLFLGCRKCSKMFVVKANAEITQPTQKKS